MSSNDLTPDSFRFILSKLISSPDAFTPDDLTHAFDYLFTPNAILPAQVGAFLAALSINRIEQRADMLTAAAKSLRERAHIADVEGWEDDFVVDIVGTGGDGHNTFNVSTTAAVVAAGAGARVCKHGSRAATSSSGSADLLESLGCVFTPPPLGAPSHLRSIPFTFILAPHYHPALALLAPYRRALPFRTLFNLLGPLINPARPRGMVLGVADRALGATFAAALRDGGVVRALVVCGAEGLDEISCAGESWAWEVHEDGQIVERTLHPRDFGLPLHPLAEVKGGTPAENSETFKRLLTSGADVPAELTPVLDFVLINASALVVVSGLANSFVEGVELARESITSGAAWEALQSFVAEGERVANQADS